MISKPFNLINAKLEEMYNDAMFYTTIQAIVIIILFDANNFCYQISQLTADKSRAFD